MSTPAACHPTIESQEGEPLSAEQVFAIARAREIALSRLLRAFVGTGLLFMLLPGTFLGVWNLIFISSRRAAESVSAAWLQAHGHAQVFGWVGSLILGIGFHSIPKLRRSGPFALAAAWVCWLLWTMGVALRWAVNLYQWHWRLLLPVSAVLELVAYLIFSLSVSGHRPTEAGKPAFDRWILVVVAASTGFLLTLLMNLGGTLYVARSGQDPAFPPALDQRFLVLMAWGFLVPFVWGFSARWMPIFLGLRPLRPWILFAACTANFAGVASAMLGWTHPATALLLAGALLAPLALRLFEEPQRAPKTRGVHPSFPFFVRIAYLWLLVAGVLGLWAARLERAGGVWGASRHALTVGFVAVMVFGVGQAVLPAFAGMRALFSKRLMFAALALLATGCALRVSSEVLAYQGYAEWAWSGLPVSAVIELAAVTIFAANLLCTFLLQPALGPPPQIGVSLSSRGNSYS